MYNRRTRAKRNFFFQFLETTNFNGTMALAAKQIVVSESVKMEKRHLHTHTRVHNRITSISLNGDFVSISMYILCVRFFSVSITLLLVCCFFSHQLTFDKSISKQQFAFEIDGSSDNSNLVDVINTHI